MTNVIYLRSVVSKIVKKIASVAIALTLIGGAGLSSAKNADEVHAAVAHAHGQYVYASTNQKFLARGNGWAAFYDAPCWRCRVCDGFVSWR